MRQSTYVGLGGPPPVEKTKGTLTLAFGRFNPPHAGHLQLMDVAAQAAAQSAELGNGDDYIIVPSRSQDPKKNPLDPDTKVSMMRQMFPQHSERIVNDGANRTIFDVLKKAHNDGYTNVRIIAGQDRVKEFDKLSQNYNGQLYQFDNMEVVSSGDRDPDAEGMEGLSSSRMRLAAAEGDFKTFRAGLPEGTPRKMAMTLFDTVRQTMNVQEMKEFWNMASLMSITQLPKIPSLISNEPLISAHGFIDPISKSCRRGCFARRPCAARNIA